MITTTTNNDDDDGKDKGNSRKTMPSKGYGQEEGQLGWQEGAAMATHDDHNNNDDDDDDNDNDDKDKHKDKVNENSMKTMPKQGAWTRKRATTVAVVATRMSMWRQHQRNT